jgi:hypothetical protein
MRGVGCYQTASNIHFTKLFYPTIESLQSPSHRRSLKIMNRYGTSTNSRTDTPNQDNNPCVISPCRTNIVH